MSGNARRATLMDDWIVGLIDSWDRRAKILRGFGRTQVARENEFCASELRAAHQGWLRGQLSQQDAARLVRVSASTIRRWEKTRGLKRVNGSQYVRRDVLKAAGE